VSIAENSKFINQIIHVVGWFFLNLLVK
jgi:hypothetical protein